MKPIDALGYHERALLATLQKRHEADGLNPEETLQVIALVRKAAKKAKRRIPKALREDIAKLEDELKEAA